MAQAIAGSRNYVVPQSYQGNPQNGPSNQQVGGPSNLPIIGWTAQNSEGNAFHEPYDATDMGRIPDWAGDANPIGAGTYDMNEVVAYGDYNPLNRAPLGDGLLQYDDYQYPDFTGYDVGGSVGGDAEY